MPGFRVAADGKITFNGRNIDNILIEQDDLSGADYGMVTRSLSTEGIDKIQVIKNYKDPQIITSTLSHSNKQVLNITFKNQYLNRVFGNIAAKVGDPRWKYELDGQAISLVHKIKILGLAQANTIGNTQLGSTKSAAATEAGSEEQELMDLQPEKQSTIASVSDITNSLTEKEAVTSNQTATSSISLLSRPWKNVILKGLFKYTKDDFTKSTSTNQQLFLPPQTLTVLENKNTAFNNIGWNNTVSLNLMITRRDQLILAFRAENGNTQNKGSGVLQERRYEENLTANDNRYTGKITFNHLFKDRSAFIFDVMYSRNRIPATYGVAPPLVDSFFFPPGGFSNLRQKEAQELGKATISGRWIKTWPRHELTLTLKGTHDYQRLNNSIDAFDMVKDSLALLQPDSATHVLYRRYDIALGVTDVWKLNKRMTISTKLGTSLVNLQLQPVTSTVKSTLNSLPVYGGLTSEFKLTRIDEIS